MGQQGRQEGRRGPAPGQLLLASVTLSHGLVIWKDKPRSRVVVSV